MAVPGNGISGIKGDALLGATQISEVTKWSWNPKQTSKDYSSNKTGGAKKRISSVKDGSGTIEGVWDPYDPITDHMDVGTSLTLDLQHTTGQKWVVPAVIESLKFDVDIDSGEVEKWSADFSSDGTWTAPTALAATTTVAPFMAPVPERAEPMPTFAGQPARQAPPSARPQAVPQQSGPLSPEQMAQLVQAVTMALAQSGAVFMQPASGSGQSTSTNQAA